MQNPDDKLTPEEAAAAYDQSMLGDKLDMTIADMNRDAGRPEERCFLCDEPTGRAGKADDSLYDAEDRGPYCGDCFDAEIQRNFELLNKNLRVALANYKRGKGATDA